MALYLRKRFKGLSIDLFWWQISLLLILFFKNFSFFKMVCFSSYPFCFRNYIIMYKLWVFCTYTDFVFDEYFQFKDSPSNERYIKKNFLVTFSPCTPPSHSVLGSPFFFSPHFFFISVLRSMKFSHFCFLFLHWFKNYSSHISYFQQIFSRSVCFFVFCSTLWKMILSL